MSENAYLSSEQAASLLQFYADAGVVDLLDDDPVDRIAQTVKIIETQKKRTAQAHGQIASRGSAGRSFKSDRAPNQKTGLLYTNSTNQAIKSSTIAVPDQASIDDAKALAKSAKTLDELRKIVAGFDGCNLKIAAKNTVFSDGNPEAPIMLIGEAPGRDEDQQGRPFVGRAGQLLDRMLAAIELNRDTCYITNVIPWRPPGNRTPVAHEIELCRPFIERHIELIQPKLLVFMGNVSNKTLLNTNKGILSMRGTWSTLQVLKEEVPTMSTLHPAYLLRNPIAKRNAWMDLLSIKAKLRDLQIVI